MGGAMASMMVHHTRIGVPRRRFFAVFRVNCTGAFQRDRAGEFLRMYGRGYRQRRDHQPDKEEPFAEHGEPHSLCCPWCHGQGGGGMKIFKDIH